MELNTSVWGEGVASRYSNNFHVASIDEDRANFANLVSADKITINEYLDDSIFWCVTKMNNPITKYSTFLCLKDSNTQNFYIYQSRFENGGQTNFMFINSVRSTGFTKWCYSSNSSTNLYNYTLGFNHIILTTDNDAYPVVRVGRKKVVMLAMVHYVTGLTHSGDNWTYENSGSKSLYEFMNDSSLYGNSSVGIYKITFRTYTGTEIEREDYSGTFNLCAIYNHKSINEMFPNYNWSDYDWGNPSSQTNNFNNPDYLPAYDSLQYGGFIIGTDIIDIKGELRSYDTAMLIRATAIDDKWQPIMVNGRYFLTVLLDHNELMNQFHKIAHAGLFYTDKISTAESTNLNIDPPTDDHLYWGIVTNGYATGRYGQGGTGAEVATTNPDLVSSTGPDVDPDFDGNEDTDTTDYIDDTPLEEPKLSTVGVFNRTYAMTANQLMILADDLWNADLTKFEEIIEGLGLMGENPMNGLIDCRLYPFDITKLLPVFQSESIVLGRTVMQAMGYKLSNDLNAIIDLGECDFRPYFNKEYYDINAPSYLDYSPYTEARLYIPYCGFVPIDTAEFMGHHITAKMVIDVVTGTCCAIVYKDGIIAIKANGVVGVSIPMTGTDSATYAMTVTQGLISGSVQIASGVGKIVAGGIGTQTAGTSLMKSSSGGVNASGAYGNNSFSTSQFSRDTNSFGRRDILRDQGATGQIINGAWQLHQAAATPVQYAQAGSASPSCETWLPQYPYFIVDRTVPEIPFNYGHTVGFACFVNEQLSMFSGFTICSNVDTSGFSQATESERAELKMLLESGVFLPVSN